MTHGTSEAYDHILSLGDWALLQALRDPESIHWWHIEAFLGPEVDRSWITETCARKAYERDLISKVQLDLWLALSGPDDESDEDAPGEKDAGWHRRTALAAAGRARQAQLTEGQRIDLATVASRAASSLAGATTRFINAWRIATPEERAASFQRLREGGIPDGP